MNISNISTKQASDVVQPNEDDEGNIIVMQIYNYQK